MCENSQNSTRKLFVATIDFGTTFSGWSYLPRSDFLSEPTKVRAKNWNNSSNMSPKTPTTILIAPDGITVEGFGYEAEDLYEGLASENEHLDHYYFRRFKMALYDKMNLKRDIVLDDETGKTLPALRVFSLAIEYLRDDFLTECNKTVVDEVKAYEIEWVITVPAIWNDAAKQFMREAAEMAGIPNDNVTIALEPEAASIFCKHLSVEKHSCTKGLDMDTFSSGSSYIVFDAGGGTVDITVHEVLPDDKIKELHSASGGAWGGTQVDADFQQFLIKIFGAPIMKKFKKNNMDDYLEINRSFEFKKRIVSSEEATTYFHIPVSLVELFCQETGETLEGTIQQMNFQETVRLFPGNKLQLKAECMRGFFGPAVKSILEHLQELMRDPVIQKSKFMLMVGGFSESVYLQENIRQTFPDLRIIIPQDAGLAVLKGAAIYGHYDQAISVRVSKLTYGFIGFTDFIDGTHPLDKSVKVRGQDKLKDAFIKLVEVGEPVEIGESREWNKNRVPSDDEDFITFPLYGSEQKNPVGTWSDDTFRIGVLTAKITNMSVPREKRQFRVSGKFGQTEIELQALELSTGELTTVKFDAL